MAPAAAARSPRPPRTLPPAMAHPPAITPLPGPPRKKRRGADRALPSPTPSSTPPHTPPPGAAPRRRAPPLERLPRWLFLPRRHFVVAHGELPLPRRVAVRGKPFYDWDAWALALLAPDLWRRRGPWHRLIACCTAAKPPHVDAGHVPDVKAALVRIVVAEVVSQLVSRSEDHLTPEDRNWITSVASRQRGRHAKKPTLMLLFDLAFAVFDLAAFCRRREAPATEVVLDKGEGGAKEPQLEPDSVKDAIRRIVADACRSQEEEDDYDVDDAMEKLALPPGMESAAKRGRSARAALSVYPVVRRILHVVHHPGQDATDTLIDNVNKVIDVIEKLLAKSNAQRWHHYFTSKADAAKDGLMQAAKFFSQHMPLRTIKSVADLKRKDALSEWLLLSLDAKNWVYWAELANDCNYIILTGSIPEEQVREDTCRYIVKSILSDLMLSVDGDLLEVIIEQQMQYNETMLTVRRLLDMALGLEQFYSFFVETYGNDSAVGNCITWGVLCFEGLVQLLGRLRNVLILGSSRERAMIDWSARSLDIANYYREAVLVNPQMCEDIDRAIQSAFSEASWPSQTRALRFIVQPTASNGADAESTQMPCFWLASLDLADPVFLATAIVPWDPHRSLKLLDQAIGLSEATMKSIRDGKEGLPLWDYRRVAICRLLSYRGIFQQAGLILERLQLLFDQKALHDGGNFSADTIRLLEAAVKENNVCAQTTYGLLLAGQGAYWDVARSWANCDKSVAVGIQKLYLSAVAGDLEACTALSHIWAQCGPDTAEVFEGVVIDQVYALFKTAVTSQNAKAVMNMGVIWRYGVAFVEPNFTIAIDAFLMALQGGVFGEARAVAATHLSETIGETQAGMSEVLSKLTSTIRTNTSSASSPYRIDDFCGSNQ